jgi:hypothetical protein
MTLFISVYVDFLILAFLLGYFSWFFEHSKYVLVELFAVLCGIGAKISFTIQFFVWVVGFIKFVWNLV